MKACIISISVCFLLFATTAAVAQDAPDDSGSSSRTFFGITGGAGIGTLGFAATGNIFLRFDHHLLSLRAAGTASLFRDELYDVGLLYGYVLPLSTDLAVSALAGLGMMGGKHGGSIFDSGTQVAKRLSLPLEARLVYTVLDFLGIGIVGFADINTDESFAGLTLGLQVGSLR